MVSGGLQNQGRASARIATLHALALSALFVLAYGAVNWLTSLRSDVGTCFAAWELRIPLIPGMLVPYLSCDLFFLAAFFLCRDVRELRMLSKRIAAALLI